MPREVSLSAAAAALGMSADSVRRRLTDGRLSGRRDERNRWLVTLPDAESLLDASYADTMQRVAELEHRIVDLERQLAVLAQERQQVAADRIKYWHKVSATLGRLLHDPNAESQTQRYWWQFWRR